MCIRDRVGWTISRCPILLIGRRPWRLNASRTRASYRANVSPCRPTVASNSPRSSCCTRMTEVAEAMATGWERAPQRARQRSAARRIGSKGSATDLATADTLAVGHVVVGSTGPTDHSQLGCPGDRMHPGGALEPEAVSVVEPLRPGVLGEDPQGHVPVAGGRLHQVVSQPAALLVHHDVDRVELPGCWCVGITCGPSGGQPDDCSCLIEGRGHRGLELVDFEPQSPPTRRWSINPVGVQGLAPNALPWRLSL